MNKAAKPKKRGHVYCHAHGFRYDEIGCYPLLPISRTRSLTLALAIKSHQANILYRSHVLR